MGIPIDLVLVRNIRFARVGVCALISPYARSRSKELAWNLRGVPALTRPLSGWGEGPPFLRQLVSEASWAFSVDRFAIPGLEPKAKTTLSRIFAVKGCSLGNFWLLVSVSLSGGFASWKGRRVRIFSRDDCPLVRVGVPGRYCGLNVCPVAVEEIEFDLFLGNV